MTDRRASSEGSQPPSRHRSPSVDDPQHHYDSLNHATGAQPAGASRRRRRPSRTSSGAKDSPQPTSPAGIDTDKETGTGSKAGRNTVKKLPRRDSLHVDTSLASPSEQQELEKEENTVGFVPKLSQIQEGKVSKAPKSQGSSTASSTIEPQAHRRRHTEDNALGGPGVPHKHGPQERHAGSFANLPHPSLNSVLSDLTQQSAASTGSTSTITQKSYNDQSHMSKAGSLPEMELSKATRASNTSTPTTMDAAQSDVFQFLNQGSGVEYVVTEGYHSMASSSAASSSSSSSDDTPLDGDGQSSNAGESQNVTDSPMTSPASIRRSDHDGSRYGRRDYHSSSIPLYASSFVHGHGDEGEEQDEDEDEDEDEEDEEEEEDEDEVDSEANSDEDHNDGKADSADSGHMPNKAVGRAPLPRAPSTSSRHSDPHTRRLRQQERELANHVLQSPQPHKDFQFSAEPSASAYPPMPLYSPRAYSGASPAGFHATADQAPAWPPMPPLPAPLPIGYSSRSPEARHALPMTVRPPMGAPESSVQQAAPPFHPYPTQPPLYQPHAPGPDLSRTTVVGYELLADKLSEPSKDRKPRAGNIVPMYRKFEHLNHRVLLHLQDEICELEEELRYLDESIAQTSPRNEAGHAYPASRRGDARYGSELHFRRTELLGRIFQKLGQYNQALSSFNNLLKDLDPASPEATRAYRTWVEKREPIDYVETRFLERKHDLLAVSRKTSISTVRGAAHHHSAAVWFPLTLILPLMAFAIVPNLLGRLFVIVLIGGVELKLVTSTPELMSFMTVQEWTTAASVYFGLNVLLAGLVR